MAQTNESQEQVTINVETLQPVTRTLMTIGALPTSYLISMTYEEQLLWLQNYLIKTVIPAINNNAEATKEVQDIVMALQDYINTQFSELNLQEYVDNKLDEMLESGVFENILMDYVQLTKVYDTYNDMIFDASTFTNGIKLKTMGYHFINDGGGAEYVVTNVQNNNKYQVSIGNNLWVEMIPSERILPEQFGAFGDGITDDSIAFQTAIDYCYTKGGYIWLLSKKYKINNTLIVKPSVEIRGTYQSTLYVTCPIGLLVYNKCKLYGFSIFIDNNNVKTCCLVDERSLVPYTETDYKILIPWERNFTGNADIIFDNIRIQNTATSYSIDNPFICFDIHFENATGISADAGNWGVKILNVWSIATGDNTVFCRSYAQGNHWINSLIADNCEISTYQWIFLFAKDLSNIINSNYHSAGHSQICNCRVQSYKKTCAFITAYGPETILLNNNMLWDWNVANHFVNTPYIFSSTFYDKGYVDIDNLKNNELGIYLNNKIYSGKTIYDYINDKLYVQADSAYDTNGNVLTSCYAQDSTQFSNSLKRFYEVNENRVLIKAPTDYATATDCDILVSGQDLQIGNVTWQKNRIMRNQYHLDGNKAVLLSDDTSFASYIGSYNNTNSDIIMKQYRFLNSQNSIQNSNRNRIVFKISIASDQPLSTISINGTGNDFIGLCDNSDIKSKFKLYRDSQNKNFYIVSTATNIDLSTFLISLPSLQGVQDMLTNPDALAGSNSLRTYNTFFCNPKYNYSATLDNTLIEIPWQS